MKNNLFLTFLLVVASTLQAQQVQVSTFAGRDHIKWQDGTGTKAIFQNPRGIIASGKYLYVADEGNHRIRKITIATGAVTTLAGGSVGYKDGTGNQAKFSFPSGLTIAGEYLYVTDAANHRIRKVHTTSGKVTTIAGNGVAGHNDNDKGDKAQFNFPQGMAIKGDNLYIADGNNHRIRVLNIKTTKVTTLAGSGVGGFKNEVGLKAQFQIPVDLVVSGDDLYVADANNHRIRKVNIKTKAVSTLAGGNPGFNDATGVNAKFAFPLGIAISGKFLYVADGNNYRIRRVSIDNGAVSTIAGDGTPGIKNGKGDKSSFTYTQRLTVSNGFLYVTDQHAHRIRKVKIADKASDVDVTTYAGRNHISWQDGTGADAVFHNPMGIALDGDFLYVSDTENHRIRKVHTTTGAVTTLAGGKPGFADATGDKAMFNGPSGIAISGDYLYVAERNNHRIRKVHTTTRAVTTLAGGKAGFADGTADKAMFNAPVGVAVSGDYLYVADAQNHRIRKIVVCPTIAQPVATNQSHCPNKTVADLKATVKAGESVQWYDKATGGIPLANDAKLKAADYFAEAKGKDNCVSEKRTKVTVTLKTKEQCVTSLSKLEQIGIAFYPNPVNNKVSINRGNHSDLQVQIIDNAGRLLMQVNTSQQITNLDMSHYSPGIYHISMTTNSHHVVERLVKN